MGRLTKKFDDGYGSTDCYHSCFDCYGNECESVTLMVEKLAHYEDMEEQGRLIVLKPRNDMSKDALISSLVHSNAICPEDMGFEQEDNDCKLGCHECWKKYLAEAKLKELEVQNG